MNICILGAGAYGLCLGINALENKNNVTVWTKFEDEKNNLINTRKSLALPNIIIDKRINITTNLENALNKADLIIIALPANTVRSVLNSAKKFINANNHICIATKGIEQDTCKFMSDIVSEITATNNISVISGPSFAIDVANKNPIGLSVASKNIDTMCITKKALQNNNIKLVETNDLIGIQLCGSIKNVMAITCGILNGMNYPISTQAMFITEFINTVKYLIIKLGGDENTLTSFAGIGDIILTCSSYKSRNYTFGDMLGSRSSKEIITKYINDTNIEGLNTLKSISSLLKKEEISIPLINKLIDIIYNGAPVDDLISVIK